MTRIDVHPGSTRGRSAPAFGVFTMLDLVVLLIAVRGLQPDTVSRDVG